MQSTIVTVPWCCCYVVLFSCVPGCFAQDAAAATRLNVTPLIVQDRYASLVNDPDTPPFHYGSHYSSAGALRLLVLRCTVMPSPAICCETNETSTGSAATLDIQTGVELGCMPAAGIVLFYLIRQEPWAKLARSLQVGGREPSDLATLDSGQTFTCEPEQAAACAA